MTSNNLRTHIAWLLSAKPFIPPPTYLNTPISQLPPSTNPIEAVSSSNPEIVANDVYDRARTQPQPPGVPTIRPSLLSAYNSTVENITTTEVDPQHCRIVEDIPSDMARLRTGPSSAAKPRLVAQELSLTPSERNRFAQKDYTPSLGEIRNNLEDGDGRKFQNATPQTKEKFSAPPSRSIPNLEMVDALDLTGDSDSRGGSSPTVQVSTVKARKRKSEDFDEDMQAGVATVGRRPVTVNTGITGGGFASIDVSEDPPPPYSSAVANKRPRPEDAVQKDRDNDDGQWAHESDFPGSETESEPEPLPSRKRKPIESVLPPRAGDSDEVLYDIPCSPERISRTGQSESRMAGNPSPAKPQPTKKRVVLDSEDEDGGFDLDLRSPSKSPVGSPIKPPIKSPTKSPIKSPTKSAIKSPIKSTIKSPIKSPSKNSFPADPVYANETPADSAGTQQSRRDIFIDKPKDNRWHGWKEGVEVSPSKTGVFLYEPDPATQFAEAKPCEGRSASPKKASKPPTVNTGTQQGSPSGITDQEKASLTEFLDWPESRLQSHHQYIGLQITAKSEAIASWLQDNDDMSPELHAEMQDFKKQSKAADDLMRISADYQIARARKDKLRARIIACFDDGLNSDAYQADINQNCAITQNLKQLEREIVRLLKVCRLLDHNGQLAGTPETHFSKQDVVVRSTQKTPFTGPGNEPLVPDSTGGARTQFVQQTQMVSTTPAMPRQYQRDYSPSNNSKSVSFDLPKIATGSSTSRVTAPSRSMTEDDIFDEDFDVDGLIADAEQQDSYDKFDRAVTSQMNDVDGDDDEEFGDDLDEQALMDVDIENHGVNGGNRFHTGQRNAFAEISGNQSRGLMDRSAPGTKKASTKSQLAMPPPAAPMQYPWSRDVKAALKDLFGLKGFRPHQAEAINATLAGKDCFVLMPTGGGKSLCYQLPSVIKSGKTRGVTIVISPLLSLMEDQVAHLRKLNIQAFYINGEIGADQRRQILNGLNDPKVEKFIQLLYVTPEMLSKNQIMINAFMDLHRRQRLSRIVIDEAHCVSQWGHDFRPDYKAIGQVRELFPGIPVMALTATATENVKVDVMHNLGIDGCEVFIQSFNRPNLHYEIRPKGKESETLDSIASTIKGTYSKQSGIVYCLSRLKCEKLAKQLREDYGIKAHHYHAGMEAAEKSKVQRQWQSGVYHVIVATIAFGMGIDKPDVRFVIHHSIPKSLEGYYQETGRAGRDGKRSGCFLYYGYTDSMALRKMITDPKEKISFEQTQRQLEMLRNVIMFCENRSDCRRVQVLAYFNEPFSAVDCNAACDNCNSTLAFEDCDLTDYAKQAIKLVQKVEDYKVTLHQLIDIFRGKVSKKVKESGYDDLPEFGAGAELELCDVERLFYRLMSEGALSENNVANRKGFVTQYIKMGQHWQNIYYGRKRVQLNVRVSSGKSKQAAVASKKAIAPKKAATSKKPTVAKKRQLTGVAAAAACDDYPLSTNVSSPVQAASRRRKVREPADASRDEGDYHNGYCRDDFVVEDHESDEDSDGFEPVKTGPPRKRSVRAEVGPPITFDQKMNSLNDSHQDVVEHFVDEGRRICGDIRTKYSLREHPFSDTILREMAIRFPMNEAEMGRIPGIRPEMVKEYGKKFLHLIETSRDFYESMMTTEDSQRTPLDPNREVVEISDDDEEYGGDINFDDEDSSQDMVRSSYFGGNVDDAEVAAFNARLPQTQAAAAISAPARKTSGVGSKQRGSFTKGGRRSAGSPKGQSSGRVTKRKAAPRSRTSGGTGYSGGRPRRGGGGGVGMGGMPMMPA